MLHPVGACGRVYIWRYYLGLVYLEFRAEGPLTETVVYPALTLRCQLEETLSYHPWSFKGIAHMIGLFSNKRKWKNKKIIAA